MSTHRTTADGARLAARLHLFVDATRSTLTSLIALLPLAAALSTAAAFADEPAAAPADTKASASAASSEPSERSEDPSGSFFAETTVTATGSERDVFEVATPVTVISAEEIERLAPRNAAALLRDQPGVDVNGVGPNQGRPVIRGQRGLRVLFLEDGLRLNNARRQTDFGEITGLVDMESVGRVEVIRGPASVLYGSDAIGGVLNLVTKPNAFADGRALGGSARIGAGAEDDSVEGGVILTGIGGAAGASRRFDYQIGYSNRSAGEYSAPAGSFGDVELDDEVTVNDTGLDDQSLWGSFGIHATDRHSFELRAQRYRAEETGFGFVEPELFGDDEAFRIRILYPYQDFDRYALTYLGSALDLAVADSIQAKLYRQENRRQLANDIDIDIGPVFPGAPNSSVTSDTLNETDLDTTGLRLESIKALGESHLLTWGAEGFRDESTNTDFSTTTSTFRFPFPPSVIGDIPGFTCRDFAPPFECEFTSTDSLANAPNATNSSWGLFAQDEWTVAERVRLTGGLRYQRVSTNAEATPGWDISGLDFDDDALVGSLNATWQVTETVNLLASYGTAFRAPSIVERLFNGLTPEGSGFQILNPDLESEESDNVDIGIKYRRRNAFMELVAFRTEVDGGIVQYFLSEEEIAQLPEDVRAEIEASQVGFVVQQRNADRLRYQGVELALGYRTANGFTFGGNYTYLDAERLDSVTSLAADTYGDKLVAYVRWEPSLSRPLWVEYRFRHNASADLNLDPNEPVPAIGSELPAFSVHNLAAGVTLFEHDRFAHDLRLEVENLTDELYAEFSNATFFRPEPGRNFRASYRLRF